MLKYIYYCYRNLIFYRVERPINRGRLGLFCACSELVDYRYHLTNMMLASVGLQVADKDLDHIPWYIPLSNIQKQWISIANDHGYNVTLL